MNVLVGFDPSQDEVQAVVLQVLANYDMTLEDLVDAEGEPETDPTPQYPDNWNRRKMYRYMDAMKPTAQKATLIIAKSANGVSTDKVMAKLGITHTPEYAGAMASAGFAARNTPGVRNPPWRRDGSIYTMAPAIAELVIDVSNELGISV